MSSPQRIDDAVVSATAALEAGIAAVDELDLDALDDARVKTLLETVHTGQQRLAAHRTVLASTLADRRSAAARAEHPHDTRAGARARRQTQNELADDLRLTPSEAKRELATGRRLRTLPQARERYGRGDISAAHVRVLDEVLSHFVGDERRTLEAELLTAAGDMDAVAFGRHARARLAELDHRAAMDDLDRQYARRRAAVTQTPTGTTRLTAEGPGLDAEYLHTAIQAFRRPDTPDEHRSSDAATWDALVDMAKAALDGASAPTVHGHRPHVTVRFNDQTLREKTGVGHAGHTGPLPYGELVRVLDDCRLAGLLCDRAWLPLEVTSQTRNVPTGLWRALVDRDGGCIWPGCDAPPGWCDVAHLFREYVRRGRLTLPGAGLLCRRHHRRYDHGPFHAVVVDRRPVICRSDGRPLDPGVTLPDGTSHDRRRDTEPQAPHRPPLDPIDRRPPLGSADHDPPTRFGAEARRTYRLAPTGTDPP